MFSARVGLGIFTTEEVYLTTGNRRDVRPLAVTSYERDSYYSQAELDSTRLDGLAQLWVPSQV